MMNLMNLQWTSIDDARQAIANGVDPADRENWAIRWAARYGYLPIVEFLSQLPGIDPATQDNATIRLAADGGHLDVVEFLASLPGVDPAAEDNWAIKWSAQNGHLPVVEFLASLPGVDPASQDNLAIRWAASNGHLPVVEFLSQQPSVLIQSLHSKRAPFAKNDLFSEFRKCPSQWSPTIIALWLNVPEFYTRLSRHLSVEKQLESESDYLRLYSRHLVLQSKMSEYIQQEIIGPSSSITDIPTGDYQRRICEVINQGWKNHFPLTEIHIACLKSAIDRELRIIPDLHSWILRYMSNGWTFVPDQP